MAPMNVPSSRHMSCWMSTLTSDGHHKSPISVSFKIISKDFDRPWQDSNLQSPDPKSGALSIRPHGQSCGSPTSPPTNRLVKTTWVAIIPFKWTLFGMFPCTCFGSTYTKIGTIQRRLAWPLRKDDTQNREAFHIFASAQPDRPVVRNLHLSKATTVDYFTTFYSHENCGPIQVKWPGFDSHWVGKVDIEPLWLTMYWC